MVQNKKQTSSKPKFAEVIIGDKEAKESLPVDMRKQFQGLQGIVNEEFGRYLTQDEAFIFIGKTRKTAKVLHRESNGLTLYVRKLSEGRFQIIRFSQYLFVPLYGK